RQSSHSLLATLPHSHISLSTSFFFFNDTSTPEIYTLSLHDALPISSRWVRRTLSTTLPRWNNICRVVRSRPSSVTANSCCCGCRDRKSTRLNSSHVKISYAVFCLKKKKNNK